MRSQKIKEKGQRSMGYSIIEMLVVIFIFTLLAVVVTQSIALVLKGTAKSESVGEVRANVEYAISVMERTLRNAGSIDCTQVPDRINYASEVGLQEHFNCDNTTKDEFIDSSQYGRLTNPGVVINCSGGVFSCPDATSVDITIIATSSAQGALGAKVRESVSVVLRSKYNE